MDMYTGVIIEESLINIGILKQVHIVDTKVEKVTARHRTPWIQRWTVHTVTFAENQAQAIAQRLSVTIDTAQVSSWYADFKNSVWHYIVFPHKVFKIKRNDAQGYHEAKKYGISLGIPEYQVDFAPDDTLWQHSSN